MSVYRARYDSLKLFFESQVRDLPCYTVGDLVLLRNPRRGKLVPFWRGPYRVTAITANNTVELENLEGKPLRLQVNLRRLKAFVGQVQEGGKV